MATSLRSADAASRIRARVHIPAEGEDGLFSQSWFPVAFSADVPAGKVVGRDFLDGRVVVFRGEGGEVSVMGAYCAHVGADLSLGTVIGDTLRCAFHHWQYDQGGACVRTGVGDAPPKDAKLFKFPTQEKYGLIWVFNGETPLFPIPEFDYPEAELELGSPYPIQHLACDPWVFCANTPDMQHLKFVHGVKMEGEDPHDRFQWDDFGFIYGYTGIDGTGVPITTRSSIRGTSIFFRSQVYGGFWRGSIVGFGLPRPGWLDMYSINAVRKGPNAREELEVSNTVSRRILSEDKDIMNTVHYRIGQLTKGDRSLSRFLDYVRKYPRAHPSADYVN